MPIYEYECEKCGSHFEVRTSIHDIDKKLSCPKCGATNPRRVLSLFSTPSSGGSCAASSTT